MPPRFDPPPFHLPDKDATNSLFGRLCASDWHTCVRVMRWVVDQFVSRSTSLGSAGLAGVTWLQPVDADEPLQVRLRGVDSRPWPAT